MLGLLYLRLQPAVADPFLRLIPGRLGADMATIGADRALAGPVSRPKPPHVSASQLMD